MIQRAAVIEALNEAISIEHTLAMQCFQQAQTIRGLWRLQLAPYFSQLGEEARAHAEKFGHKVVALGGVPTVIVGDVKLSTTGPKMLEDNLALERIALTAYMKALELAGGDLALRTMLEDHIESEQRHIEDLELLTQDSSIKENAASMRRVS